MSEPEETCDGYWMICPHCGHRHRDAWEMVGGDEEEREHDCDECGKAFICWGQFTTTYHAKVPTPVDAALQDGTAHPERAGE